LAWNGSYSHDIKILNGVRQGAVLSPVLFCICFGELIYALKPAKYGSYIGFCFVGVLAYADDLVLLAPSPNASRNMLKICDEFGQRYSVIFNAIKSKCLLCLSSNKSCRLPHATTPVFYIGGNVLEFVNEWPHLGHVISTSGAMICTILSLENLVL